MDKALKIIQLLGAVFLFISAVLGTLWAFADKTKIYHALGIEAKLRVTSEINVSAVRQASSANSSNTIGGSQKYIFCAVNDSSTTAKAGYSAGCAVKYDSVQGVWFASKNVTVGEDGTAVTCSVICLKND